MSQDEVVILVSLHSDSLHKKIERALDWSKKYIISNSEIEDYRKIAALVLFYELAIQGSTTIGETLCREASADSSDIAPWLRNNFHFPKDEVYTMLKTWMNLGVKKLPFSHVGLNGKYEIMQEASSRGDVGLIRWLLQNGVEVDGRDSDDSTALHVAAQQGNKDLVLFLLKNGASIFRMDNSRHTPFYKAFDSGHFDTADLLGPRLFLARTSNLKDILITAAGEGSAEKVEYLLKFASHPRKYVGRALSVAASKGYFTVVEAMINLCPWCVDDFAMINLVLKLALNAGHARTVETLLSVGPDLDRETKDIALNNSSILRIFKKYENSSDGSQIDVE